MESNWKSIAHTTFREGLQVRVHSRRKRAGVSSIAPIDADAGDAARDTTISKSLYQQHDSVK